MKQTGATKCLRVLVIDAGLCAYCGACVNLCPYFLAYNDRIVIRDECSRTDGGCLDVCPQLPTNYQALSRLFFDEADLTPELGAVKAFHITRAADENVRMEAQHGGTVTALIKLALEEGLIEASILTGEAEPMLPTGVAVGRDGLSGRYAKSKFVASPNIAALNELLKTDVGSVGIVATPCQAQALAKMKSSQNPGIRENGEKIRLVIGLFCGWAFSSSALKELLSEKVPDTNSILGMDIPPSRYNALEVFTPDGKVSIPLDEVRECVRPACRSCHDMTAEFSDISVGSARLPEGWEKARSWNQVLVRTDVGEKLMDLAKRKGVLEFREVPEGNLENLKKASANKKKTAQK
ncbi:MAG: Coenzyme F420 hydrogenase/dehydrogenase, beta subunit C-terminal domain [Desulfobacteraceae bacterium]|jgi:coenzyme F420 hydrogenase subunit beta